MIKSSETFYSRLYRKDWLNHLTILSALWAVLGTATFSGSAQTAQIKKVIHQYALTSANDFPERDPCDWRLLGSMDGGRNWTTLDVRTNQIFSARQQRKLYQIDNQTAFGTYRLEIAKVRDPASASSIQLAELELLGLAGDDSGPTPGFTDIVSAEGDNPPAETLANLFDGRPETKWLDWVPDKPNRASWVQWQYADLPKVQKVIHQYAMTSANDFPQRDPGDWRLLGSTNGGRSWITLDVRSNEIFSARQQRKLYQINNQTAFETYRLEIDKVRDPGTASSVQIAEVELMGLTQDDRGPTPVFTDATAAQGDNPPAETVANLFDGRPETKWLDWALDESTLTSWIQWQYATPTNAAVTNFSQLEALRIRAGDGIPVRIEGVVAGWSGSKLCLVDTTGWFEQEKNDAAKDFNAGEKVLITGISDWANNSVRIKESHLQILNPAAATHPDRISLEQPLNENENLKWVEIEGEIQHPNSAEGEFNFDVQNGRSSMRVHLRCGENSFPLPPPGTRISVSGICSGAFNGQGQWVAANLWAANRESLIIPASHDKNQTPLELLLQTNPAPINPTELTTIEQIRRLSQEQLKARPQVKIRGVITDELQGFIQDDTGGIEVSFTPDEKRKIIGFGIYLDIEGWAGLDEGGGPEIFADHITVLGPGKLPQPQKLSSSQFTSSQIDAQWIELQGVVRSTDGSHLLITCYGQQLMAAIAEAPVAVVNGLVDAEVRVCGVGVTARDNQGRVQGTHLLIPSLEYVDVITPANPETLPVRKIGNLLGLSGPLESFHRVKVEGVVTFQQNQKIFLQDDTGSAMAILKENVVLDARFGRSRWLYWQTPQTETASGTNPVFYPGERVQVVGFTETHRYSPVLTEAVLTRLGASQPLKPISLTSEGLAQGGLDSSLVTFDGVLRGQTMVGANVILELEWQDRTLQVLMPKNEGDLLSAQLGSRLRVTGVCQIDPPSYPELGLVVGPARILTRSPDDLVILARPPWWTVRRALALIGGMTLLILIGLTWIRELRRQVGERTVQLSTEIQLRERVESHHALEQERARIARDLHDDLGANLTQIIFLSERVEVARHDGQEVAHWFELIPATARRTIQSLDEIVWAIDPRHDSLESLANYLSQFVQEYVLLARLRCILDVPTVLPPVPLSAEVRHNLLLTTREALQNAVTHAGASEVNLSLQLNEEGLNITISDNGKGFDPNGVSPAGNGLRNMRLRLEAIGGRLGINSQPGKGVSIILFIPKNMLHGRVIGRNGIITENPTV